MKVTTIFNTLAIVVAVAQAFGFTGEVNPDHQIIVTGVIGIVNLVLYLWKQYGDQGSNVVQSL
jgi:uncharacterized membrane protein